MAMLFVGIDLAWSKKNGTGVAVIEESKNKAKLKFAKIIFSDEDIINCLKEEVGHKKALVAIDAPLIVPNEEGRRFAEELVGMLFRKYDAGAHPANRKRLSSWDGNIRGEEISRLLEKEGFTHSPYIKKFENKRKFFEVYPHPSIVVLFNLDKIIKYKAKPRRDYEFRWKEFKKYQKCMRSLEKNNPKLILPKEIIKADVRKLKAKKLKNYEDKLDAIFCSYIAYYAWSNPDGCAVLGDMKRGYILTPVFDHMKEKLKNL